VKKGSSDFTVLKIKRAFLFLLGMVFFLFPSNNWYSIVQATYQSPTTQPINLEIPTVADYPVNFTGKPAPWLTARSAVVIDRDSVVVLFAKEEETQLLPASTVKLMTALVALDYYDLNQVLIAKELNYQGQDMELEEEEIISVKSLLYGVLVTSANDAATLLAQTYLDLARLASFALKNEVISEMVGTNQITVTDLTGEIKHKLYNINELLHWLPGMKGIKTGWTEEAGECLIGYVERDGRGVITVILGSEDRFGETARLVDWAFSNHEWQAANPPIPKQ